MYNKIIVLFVALSFFLTIYSCQSRSSEMKLLSTNPEEVLAVVNGEKITYADIEERITPELNRINNEIYEIKREAIEEAIISKMVYQTAEKSGITVQEYLTEEISGKVEEPTEKDIRSFYEFQKEEINSNYDKIKENIKELLATNRENEVKKDLIAKLKKGSDIDIRLDHPRIDIEAGESPAKGPANPPITLIEFSAYQCPHCNDARKIVERLREDFPEKIMVVFKDFPPTYLKNAKEIHESAHCAGEQGKYWQMHEILFENQEQLKLSNLKKYARKIGLDLHEFSKCMEDDKFESLVMKNIEAGERAGVTQTPTFFINGIMVVGVKPYSYFKSIVQDELGGDK